MRKSLHVVFVLSQFFSLYCVFDILYKYKRFKVVNRRDPKGFNRINN